MKYDLYHVVLGILLIFFMEFLIAYIFWTPSHILCGAYFVLNRFNFEHALMTWAWAYMHMLGMHGHWGGGGGGYEHGHRHEVAWVYGGWVDQGY